MFIYRITNAVNGKVYIGLDSGSQSRMYRWKTHQKVYLTDTSSSKLYRAMRKYGIKNFCCEIIDDARNMQELRAKEEHWIAFYDACKKGYNILPSANGGWTVNEMDDVARANKLAACSKGAASLNLRKWKNEDPDVVEHNRKLAAESLNGFYETVDRSEHVKSYWNALTPEQRDQRNSGIRNFVQTLTPEERVARAAKATIAAAKANSVHYLVIDPMGCHYDVIGIGTFSQEHNLSAYEMQKVSLGHISDHKGWKCYRKQKITGEVCIPELRVKKKRGPKPKEKS